jgi:hypothetical protein
VNPTWETSVNASLAKQLRENAVALTSLTLVVIGLAYNTWRNEQTEFNDNIRAAGFEILVTLGELERVVFHNHYDRDEERGSPRAGWAYVLTIRDMGQLSLEGAKRESEKLFEVWQDNWEGLGTDDGALQAISDQVDALRAAVLAELAGLE